MSSNIKVAYVAGNYRASTVNGIHDNIERARALAVELWRMGYAAICPHLNSAMMDGVAPDDRFMEGCIEIMRRCADCVVVLPDYDDSEGTAREIACASNNNIRVFYYPHDIRYIERFVESEGVPNQ